MTRPEYSGKRDLTFKIWHRKFGNHCYMMDIDFVEYRYFNGKPTIVAVMEDKDSRANVGRWMKNKAPIFLDIANKLNVPAYLIIHNCIEATKDNSEIWKFEVTNLKTNKKRVFNKTQIIRFIQTLGMIENANVWNNKEIRGG